MRSLVFDRRRALYLIAWLLVLGLVVGIQAMTLPSGYDDAVGLADFPAGQRDDVRRALDDFHLTPTHLAWYWIVTNALTAVIFVAMGWLLIRRGHPAGFSAYLAIVLVALSSASYPPDIDDVYPGQPVIQALVLGLTVLGVSGMFLLPLVFPDGRFVPRWTVLVALYVLVSFTLLWDAPGFLASPAFEVSSTLVLAAILIGSPIYRYRRVSTLEQRRQTRWVMFGFVIGIPAFFAGDAMMRNIDSSPLGIAFLFGFMILIQIGFNAPFLAVGTAMLFHRLFDIDIILNRTLVWIAMTVSVVVAYAGIVVGIGEVVDAERNLFLSLLATGIVAVAFQPVRARVQRAVDRFVFGERDDPYAVLSRIGHRIEDARNGSDLLPQIVRTTADALRLPYVALFLERAGGPEMVAATGIAPVSAMRLPLTYQGTTVGTLQVAPRSPGETFSVADRRLLEDLARQIGIAAHAINLADALQQSREAIVVSREEERRRLRRDLHDGLGAQLAALVMMSGAIRNRLPHDPESASADIAELRDELKVAIADIRRLVHGLRPPALDELGLIGTVRSHLDRLRDGQIEDAGAAIQIHLESPYTLPPFPAAVEVAALRIIDEAIANAVRHAGAGSILVTILYAGDTLELGITDDGRGFDPSRITGGVGLHSMRERALELGGTFGIESSQGTRIRVTLPAATEVRS